MLQDTPLVNALEQQLLFVANFRASWDLLDLFGKKESDFGRAQKLFEAELKDLPGYRVNKAMIEYRKLNSKFPTPREIRNLVEEYDYDLTKEERLHKTMWQRAKTRKMAGYLLAPHELDSLQRYEKKYGDIEVSEKWHDSFDRIFIENNCKDLG